VFPCFFCVRFLRSAKPGEDELTIGSRYGVPYKLYNPPPIRVTDGAAQEVASV